MMPSILTIIVTFNGIKWLDKCLSSVKHSTILSDILIVDNGSTDGTVDYIKNNYPESIIIKANKNLGFGKANNLGLKYALEQQYDYVYLLNQDAWICPETFKTLIEVQQCNSDFGVLSPIQCNASGNLDKGFTFCCPYSMISGYISGQPHILYETTFVMAAHWLLSRKCIETVGAFSPTFPHYGEDNNYIERVHYHGFKVGIVTAIKAIHDRENRRISTAKLRYLTYIELLGSLSNPNYKNRWSHFFTLLFKSTLTSKRIHLKNLLKLIMNYPIITKNLNKSKIQGAFLS